MLLACRAAACNSAIRLAPNVAGAATAAFSVAASLRPDIKVVGVVGAGLMGAGIAQVSAAAGYTVLSVDSSTTALERARAATRASLTSAANREVKKGSLTAEAAAARVEGTLARIVAGTDMAALSGADIIIEAVPETMEIKTPIYRVLDRVARHDAILATNTSGLSVAALAGVTTRPTHFIGLHFFNPVPRMSLVEIVCLPATAAPVRDAAFAFVRATGKTPVLTADTPGFIVNRLLVPQLGAAIALVEAGVASVADVDTAMKLGAGHPMGPLHLADYVGLDTCLNVLTNWNRDFPDNTAFRVPQLLRAKVAAGDVGRKSGRGFYLWKGDEIGAVA